MTAEKLNPVNVVYGMITALLRTQDLPEDPLETEEFEELLGRCAAPGTLDYWRSLTDSQLNSFRDLIPLQDTLPAGANLVHVALVHKSIVPEGLQPGQGFWAQTSAFATVRFFPDLTEWRVERLGDLGPPQPERLN